MLPPGIYLWESGGEGVSPISVESFFDGCPECRKEYGEHLFDGKSVELPGIGRFRKSSSPASSVIIAAGPCETTMEAARLLVEKQVLPIWGVVMATEQKQGRGQLRRHWVSPVGNMYMSTVLPPSPATGQWSYSLSDLLPLVAGYVLSDVLEGLGAGVSIKWPNDLIQHDRKVGGMLIEERNGTVVLGVGLNLVESPSDRQMREDHSVPAGIIQTINRLPSVLGLAETLVNCGKRVYENLLDEFTPKQFSTMVVLRLAWLGRTVLVRESGTDSYPAVIVGISPKGGLVIRRDGEEYTLFSGSISPL